MTDPTPQESGPRQPTLPGASPARGFSWEPFREGNFAALKHGARSPRIIESLAQELVDLVLRDRPDLERYGWALQAWARAETRVALLSIFLDARGLVDEEGEPRASHLKIIQAAERLCVDLRRELGLSPVSHAHLMKETAEATKGHYDIEKLIAEGRAIRLRRERELGLNQGNDTDEISHSEAAQEAQEAGSERNEAQE